MYGNVWRAYAYHAARNRPFVLRLVGILDGMINIRTPLVILGFALGIDIGRADILLLSTLQEHRSWLLTFLLTGATVLVAPNVITRRYKENDGPAIRFMNAVVRGLAWGILLGMVAQSVITLSTLN